MATISWNEIKDRATAFAKRWENESREEAEAKTFLDEFFHIFDISRRRVATYEENVKKASGKAGFIDLLWKGTLLVEQKSRGKDLEKAYRQALDYLPNLKDYELPQYILISDFDHFHLYNLDTKERFAFRLSQLVEHIHLFAFIAGYETRRPTEQDPVNQKAAIRMGRLHDQLKATGYSGHALEVLLVRLLYCMFADDTTIFQKGIFYDFIEQRTHEDGSDLGPRMAELFQVLNTPEDRRLKNLDEQLAAFPYVNGKLFDEFLPIPAFNKAMREALLESCRTDWSSISPAIFGSLFQSVMDEKARRNLGAHYTSEKNILKLIKPLFLDGLWKDFEKYKNNRSELVALHKRLGQLRIIDPACGCGNFLIIAYRELRLLEIEILKKLQAGQITIKLKDLLLVKVDQFYGIEYDEFPAQIARVAMWLVDHQLNMEASKAFGDRFVDLPLLRTANIVHGNALRTDWHSLLPPDPDIAYDYIIGNPPFVGKQLQNAEQKTDMASVFRDVPGAGVLDYVAAWYMRAAEYLELQTSNFKLQTSNFKLQTSNFKLQTSNFKLQLHLFRQIQSVRASKLVFYGGTCLANSGLKYISRTRPLTGVTRLAEMPQYM